MKNFLVALFLIAVVGAISFYSRIVVKTSPDIAKEAEAECNFYKKDTPRNACYFSYAAGYNLLDLCDKINDDTRNDCYRAIARDTKNLSICSKVSELQKDECYFDLAQVKKDRTICEEIISEEFKFDCKQCLTGEYIEEWKCLSLDTVPAYPYD